MSIQNMVQGFEPMSSWCESLPITTRPESYNGQSDYMRLLHNGGIHGKRRGQKVTGPLQILWK